MEASNCHRAALLTGLVIGALLAPTVALGQDESALAEARERFDRGIELYDEGHPEAALAEFIRANELAPNYVVLLNIAHCYRQLDRHPQALEAFERYLGEGGDRVPADRRAEVEATLERLRRLVGTLEVSVTGPPQATILLDDTEVGQTPLERPLTVSAGPHQVEARAEGYLPSRREVTVAGEATEQLELALQPVAPPPPPTEPTVDDISEPVVVDAGREQSVEPQPLPDDPSLERARRLRVGAWITGALSLVALSVSAGLLIWNAGDFDDWQSDRDALEGDAASTSSQSAALAELEVRYARSDERLDEIQSVDAWSWSIFGLGVACLVTSVGLALGARRRIHREASLTLSPQGGTLALRW